MSILQKSQNKMTITSQKHNLKIYFFNNLLFLSKIQIMIIYINYTILNQITDIQIPTQYKIQSYIFLKLLSQNKNQKTMADPGNRQQNFEFLAADDIQYAEVQQAFARRLLKDEASLELQLKQSTQKQKMIQTQKQQIGVKLYNAQQQLAANQMAYQKAHDNYNITQRLRIESDQKLSQINQIYNSKKQQVSVLKNKVSKAQKQLQTLMRNYHQIQAYNVQLKSDIAVTKIQTFTAQENVANLEKVKKKQDLLIDSMNQESKRLEEQKNILAAQIISQKQETQQAKKILREAQSEMEGVIASKKSLLDRWQKALGMMQKRDAMIQLATEQMKNQTQKNILLKSQLNGLRSEIRKQQQATESLNMQADRITKEKQQIQLKKNQLRSLQQKNAMQLQALKSSLASTADQIKRTQQQQKTVQESMNVIESNIMKLHTETKKLFQRLIDQKSEHTTIQKTANNLLKQTHKISLQIQQKQMQLQNIQNQIARVRIDQLNTKAQIQLLEGKKAQAINEQQQKKYLVITYEVQIKQGHDINQKKQHQVGRLNKLHDQLMSKANDQGKNPLQNKLINLIRETEELESNCGELYRDWIKKQTQLVSRNNQLDTLKENVTHLENRKTIMEQKKSRLKGNYQSFEKQIYDIKISLKGLQQEMNKLNDSLAVNADKKMKLQNENVNLQSQFVQKLKEMQREAIKLQIDIDKIREEKAELMNEIVECERQILLWQRKYQLEKEMQETLDPNVGKSQIEELTKELHRMQLKYDSLIKAQDKIKIEMVRAVNKKEDIELKYRAAVKKQPERVKKQPQTSIQLKKSLQRARQNQSKIMKSLQQAERALARKQADLQNIAQALDQNNDQYRKLETQTHNLQTQRVLGKIKKNIDILKVAALQKKYKKCQQVLNNVRPKLLYQQVILKDKLQELKTKNNQLFGVIEQFMNKYAQYADLFAPLLETHKINAQV